MTNQFAKPFDKLKTTVAYAQGLADRTKKAQVIIKVPMGTQAAALGMKFGVLSEDEIQAGDPVVKTVEPVIATIRHDDAAE